MARLPIPGSDEGAWGNLLNEFLRVSHREDGTLRGVCEAVNVKDYGAVGDGVTDDVSAIRGAIAIAFRSVFFPPGTYRVNSDITFNVAIVFAPGAKLVPDPGITVTINEEILAPKDSIIFDVSNGGSFDFNWTGKIYANWWSGGDIGARWNNMRSSLPDRFKGVDEAASLAVVGLNVVTTTMNWNDMRGDYHPVKIDMSEAHLIGKTDGSPVIEMINSRHVIVNGLSIYGWIDDSTPNVGLLLARNSEGRASGEHLFSNFRFRGGYTVAAVYTVDSEVCKWVNGMIGNEHPNGRYGTFIGAENRDSVSPRWADEINDTYSMKGQWFKNVHWRGHPGQGGLYLYGADNIFVHGSFFKHGHRSIVPGPHLVLDTTTKTVNDGTFTDIFCEGEDNTAPTIGCHLKGVSAVRNCIFEFKDFGATGRGFQVDVTTQFCKFRQWVGDDFVVKSDRDMLYCDIETNPGAPTNITLGRRFSGFIRMGHPDGRLSPPSEMFFATVHDLDRGIVSNHRITGQRELTFMVSDSDPVRHLIARSRGTPENELPLQDGDVIGQYEFLARRIRNGKGETTEVCKLQAIYRGDGSSRDGDIRIVTRKSGTEHVVGRAHHDGYFILEAQNAEIADSELNNSEMTFYLNESSNQLIVKVKRSDGTVRTGIMDLS